MGKVPSTMQNSRESPQSGKEGTGIFRIAFGMGGEGSQRRGRSGTAGKEPNRSRNPTFTNGLRTNTGKCQGGKGDKNGSRDN